MTYLAIVVNWVDFVLGVGICAVASFIVAVSVVHVYFHKKRTFMDQITNNWSIEGETDGTK